MKSALAKKIEQATKGLSGALLTAFFMAALVLGFSLTGAHDRLEYVLYDLRFKAKPKAEPMSELVLLNIDDASVSALGVYPWPRHYYAFALRQLKGAGLANLVFDIQFMDSSPPLLNPDGFNTLYSSLASGNPVEANDLYSVIIDNDKDLSNAVQEYQQTILPFSFAKVESKRTFNDEEKQNFYDAVASFTKKASLPLPLGKEEIFRSLADKDRFTINYPIPELINACESFGFVDNDADLDGAHRRVRLVRVFKDRIYFHLSLIAFLRMSGASIQDLEVVPGRSITIKEAVHPLSGKRGDIVIPVDKSCAMYFDWMGDFAHSARSVSAHALIEYPFYAEQFELQLMLKDMASGKSERAELSEELENIKMAILSENDLEKRFPLRQEYQQKLARYKEVIQSYLNESEAELANLTAREQAGEVVDPENINSIKTLITAIKIKTQVEYLFDSVAIMGLTAVGTQDEGVTPLSSSYWMVGSYPTAINTLAKGNFLHKLPAYYEYLIIIALALSISLFIYKRSAKLSYTAMAIAAILMNAIIVFLFFKAYIWLDQVSMNLALLLPAAIIMVGKFAGEEEHRQFIQGAFSKYLSQDVIDQIIANPDALKLGGESCTITTFFSDIAGFSGISEKLSAEGLVHLLNEYLSEMTDIIMQNRGTVDKYEGDAIMAFWGAPLTFPEHPYLACYSALEMQKRLAEMRKAWKSQGRDELRVRMGINSGPAVAGNMGSRTRMNYTVMGDSVNLASRLEGANKAYGTSIMVSKNTQASLSDKFDFRELDTIRVVGKKEPITVFELLEHKGKLAAREQELIAIYDQGLEAYKQRRWKEALVQFTKTLKIDRDDGPSKIYYLRCRKFLENSPPENWDGVVNLGSK